MYQIENINNIFATSIEDTQYELQKQIRSVEKEYISILGIFAAIVLAFVGGITFSTSILQNMHTVSIFRLLLVIDFLAFILINIMHILVKFIFTINDKDSKFFHIYFLNAACMIIAIIIIVSWFCSINKIPDFILHYFPWNISQ